MTPSSGETQGEEVQRRRIVLAGPGGKAILAQGTLGRLSMHQDGALVHVDFCIWPQGLSDDEFAAALRGHLETVTARSRGKVPGDFDCPVGKTTRQSSVILDTSSVVMLTMGVTRPQMTGEFRLRPQQKVHIMSEVPAKGVAVFGDCLRG